MGGNLSKDIAKCLEHPENEKQARKVFGELDQEGRGRLTKGEFATFVQVVLERDLREESRKSMYAVPIVGTMMFNTDFGDVKRRVKEHEVCEGMRELFYFYFYF